MALTVFLRGVNVGGNKTFRPSLLARELSDYDVVNVGAAGTFVVWKPGLVAKFRAELSRKLPFDCEVVICEGRDLIRIATENPFEPDAPPDVVRFVSVICKRSRAQPSLPVAFPPDGQWLVRLIACDVSSSESTAATRRRSATSARSTNSSGAKSPPATGTR